MPSWPGSNSWPASRNWPTSNSWPASDNWPADFSGNFASLFPGAYQVVQTDRGLTYGGAMLANAGNTSTATMALTGSLATAPVPIWIRLTGLGTVGDIYYDGLGVTPAMSGVSVIAANPIALTGAATGLTITPVAGTQVVGDTWKATCAALADQSGNGAHAVQPGATLQPVVGIGLNGKASLIFDGVDDYLTTAALAISAGSMLYMVYRYNVVGANVYVTDGIPADRMHIQVQAGPNTEAYNGASLIGVGVFGGANIYGRLAATFNGVSSSIKVGSTGLVSGNAGSSAAGTGRTIGISGVLSLPSKIEMLALIWTPPVALATPDSAVNSSGGYGPGAIVV